MFPTSPFRRALRAVFAPSLALALVACAAGPAGGNRSALRLSDGQRLAVDALIEDLAAERPDVVFLGERHDNAEHHALQARIVAGLGARGAQPVAALAFEMIAPEQEAAAQTARGWPAPASAAASRSVGEAVGWAESGWPDWALYAPILEAAPQAYVAGGWYPRRALMGAARSADWLADEPDAARFGLDRPLPAAQQKEREAGQIAAHCDAIPAEVAPMMVAAQRARDGRLAAAVLRAREKAAAEGLTGPVVVITGSGHARRDYGAPALLAEAAPDLTIVALSLVETAAPAALDGRSAEGRFDLLLATAPQERPDPCEAFRKRG